MQDLLIEVLVVAILLLFPLWKVYARAGLSPYLSLTLLIPGFGFFIALAILAFSKWELVESRESN